MIQTIYDFLLRAFVGSDRYDVDDDFTPDDDFDLYDELDLD